MSSNLYTTVPRFGRDYTNDTTLELIPSFRVKDFLDGESFKVQIFLIINSVPCYSQLCFNEQKILAKETARKVLPG